MKVSLVVATGAHQGKVIPLTGPQFLIGRDPQCHLRPASQAISKKHCGVLVRDGKVYVKDFGSTNGTTVNEVLIKDTEVAVPDGTSLKLGPLDFVIRIEQRAPIADGTPLPTSSVESAAALAAVKAVAGAPKAPVRDATPDPSRMAKSAASRETPAPTGSKDPTPSATSVKPITDAPSVSTFDSTTDADHDRIAAMLLDMDDGNLPVPDGSTVIDSPAISASGDTVATGGTKPDDKGSKKTVQSREEMSTAASDLLRRMMRRPK
jgi:pSer/pThr/pTyr-binding forkhead associated (FHA) protein